MQKATCDECNEEFTIKLRTKDHGISVKETYFNCSNCKHKYIAYVTDPECRKMQREIAEVRASKNIAARQFKFGSIDEASYIEMIEGIERKIKRIKAELEPRMNKLKDMYG